VNFVFFVVKKAFRARSSYDDNFPQKEAEDFSRRIKSNNFESGRKTTEALAGILNNDFNVLEIGSGPGTLTIPLSKEVRNITAVEFSKANLTHLKENLREESITNVEIINTNWKKINPTAIKDRFDLVICSHFLWQMEDLEEHLERMENASKGYCAIIQPVGRDKLVTEIFEELLHRPYSGEFEPDADYFAYIILREWGRLLRVSCFDYTFDFDLPETVRYIASYIGKFIEVDQKVGEKIRNYLLKKSENGSYQVANQAVVMWWEPEE
jgi:ubiquinone/menaquinone biosynthesis C-methylase UbiE